MCLTMKLCELRGVHSVLITVNNSPVYMQAGYMHAAASWHCNSLPLSFDYVAVKATYYAVDFLSHSHYCDVQPVNVQCY